MSNFAPSTRHNTYPASAEAERRYREELVHRAVDQSRGNVGLYTSMDLNRDEKGGLAAAIAERHAATDKDGTARQLPDRGGWQDYGDVSLVDTLRQNRSLAENLSLSGLESQSSGPVPGNEKALFYTDENGNDTLFYQMSGFNDDTGRPGNLVTISMPLNKATAKELYDGSLNDPSLLDQVAIAQISALGLGAREDGFFRFTYGPAQRGGKDTWYSQGDRAKTVYRREADGALTGSEVTYANKRPIEVPGSQETAIAVVETAPQPAAEYDVQQNVADNEIRRDVLEKKSRGLTHVEIMLNLDDEARSATQGNDVRGAAARNTVFGEIAHEPLDFAELEAIGLTDENYEVMQASMKEELVETLDFFTNDQTDAEAIKRAIGVLQIEVARIESAFMGEEGIPDELKDAATLREAILMEVAEEMERRLAEQ